MMESMQLGSPVGSPTGQSPTSPYLPGFLMGDSIPQPTSPAKTPRQVHFTPTAAAVGFPNSPAVPAGEEISRLHKTQREKAGGPPTIGLFDTLEVSSTVPSPCTSPQPQSAQLAPHTPATPRGFATPTTNVSVNGNGDENERWVRVFGFPPSAFSAVLGQFAQVGHMTDHRLPGQANWVDICFASRLDARRALAYNGRVIGGNIMIGVVPCKDSTTQPGVLKDMTNAMTTPTTPRSPQVSRLNPRRFGASPATPSSPYPGSVRPLNIASPIDTQVIGSQNTPTKSTSVVTKAFDYVFGGW